MKRLFLLVLICGFSIAAYGQSESCGCNAALNKDLMLTVSTEQRAYAFLSLIDQESYEEIKHNADAGVSIPIFSAIPIVKDLFSASASYSDFVVRRNKFFQQIGYQFNEQKSLQELQVVTNPVAYPFWAECMQRCATNRIGLFAWKEREEKKYIFVTLYYHAPPDGKALKVTSTLNGGTVEGIPVGKLFPVGTKILPNGTLNALIIRGDDGEVGATISVPGFAADPIFSKWVSDTLPIGSIKLVLKRPYTDTEPDGDSCVITDYGANNHNEDCDGAPYCSPDGKWRATRLSARLDTDQSHLFVNPRFDKCWGATITGLPFKPVISEVEGAYECQFNSIDVLSVTNNGKTAEGAIRVFSRPTKWRFCADKRKIVTKFATDEKEFKPLSGGAITFVKPTGYTEAILNYTIKGASNFVNLGETSSDGILRFKNKANVGDDVYYLYDIVVPQ